MLIAAGFVSVGLGVAGIFLPVLPTTPFLLLAAACFARSSEPFHQWLLNHRILGKYIRDYLVKKGLTLRTKITAVSFIWLSIGSTCILVDVHYLVKATMLLIALLVSLHLIRLKTL